MTPEELRKSIQAAVVKFIDSATCSHREDEWPQDCMICLPDFILSQIQAQIEREKGTKMSEDLVQFNMTADYCSWCERGDKPKHLDEDGVLTSITGKPGYLCHAQDDFWWPCVPSIRREAQAEQKKRDEEIAANWASHYPTDIFIEPAPGEHGQTVDACSASAIRHASNQIAAAIKGQIEEPSPFLSCGHAVSALVEGRCTVCEASGLA